ncbi:LOW QUALITY PROTEIN: hypothetical protein TorRG33x02_052780 [Trema orientale]|uniref:Uncharacterized protein n=1 Tax=Trema orientale TaxID=63057 RepID=A0A2P5FMK9_TREOI|nr:LOW QUALITY PROTEIN: hypothetical protein TorRG33x02_052780 [Trema orientale]
MDEGRSLELESGASSASAEREPSFAYRFAKAPKQKTQGPVFEFLAKKKRTGLIRRVAELGRHDDAKRHIVFRSSCVFNVIKLHQPFSPRKTNLWSLKLTMLL